MVTLLIRLFLIAFIFCCFGCGQQKSTDSAINSTSGNSTGTIPDNNSNLGNSTGTLPDNNSNLGNSTATEPAIITDSGKSSTSLVVDGYMDKLSYTPGETAAVFINAKSSNKTVLTLYDVLGTKVDSIPTDVKPQQITTQNPWEDGYGYTKTVSYTIPNIKSGMYLWNNKIPFIIKDANKKTDIVVVYPTNTQNAYNTAGGKSMYTMPESERARVASFQRPFTNLSQGYTYEGIKWLFENVTTTINYIADHDMENYAEIANAKLILITGHSEYWTRQARLNLDRFVNTGGNALILSGNTMWWQVRYSADGSKMICYKSNALDSEPDPQLKTVNWFANILHYQIIPSIGGDFNIGGYGRNYTDRGWNGFKIVTASPAVFAGTGMVKGDILAMPSMEYDGTYLSGFDIAGYPIVDKNKLGFYQAEIIGFDYGLRGGLETIGTWMAFRKAATSGIIINGASTDWCNSYGIGGTDSVKIKQIISNMIHSLLNNTYVFQ